MTVEEESTHKTGSWDQFEGNAHLINQPSTYNELLYTTPIPTNIPEDWCKKADSISHGKSTPDTGREDGSDEEMNHSRVLIGPDHEVKAPQSDKDSVYKKKKKSFLFAGFLGWFLFGALGIRFLGKVFLGGGNGFLFAVFWAVCSVEHSFTFRTVACFYSEPNFKKYLKKKNGVIREM